MTLKELFSFAQKPLPSVSQRGPLFEAYGLGRKEEYLGTIEQNIELSKRILQNPSKFFEYFASIYPEAKNILSTQIPTPATEAEGLSILKQYLSKVAQPSKPVLPKPEIQPSKIILPKPPEIQQPKIPTTLIQTEIKLPEIPTELKTKFPQIKFEFAKEKIVPPPDIKIDPSLWTRLRERGIANPEKFIELPIQEQREILSKLPKPEEIKFPEVKAPEIKIGKPPEAEIKIAKPAIPDIKTVSHEEVGKIFGNLEPSIQNQIKQNPIQFTNVVLPFKSVQEVTSKVVEKIEKVEKPTTLTESLQNQLRVSISVLKNQIQSLDPELITDTMKRLIPSAEARMIQNVSYAADLPKIEKLEPKIDEVKYVRWGLVAKPELLKKFEEEVATKEGKPILLKEREFLTEKEAFEDLQYSLENLNRTASQLEANLQKLKDIRINFENGLPVSVTDLKTKKTKDINVVFTDMNGLFERIRDVTDDLSKDPKAPQEIKDLIEASKNITQNYKVITENASKITDIIWEVFSDPKNFKDPEIYAKIRTLFPSKEEFLLAPTLNIEEIKKMDFETLKKEREEILKNPAIQTDIQTIANLFNENKDVEAFNYIKNLPEEKQKIFNDLMLKSFFIGKGKEGLIELAKNYFSAMRDPEIKKILAESAIKRLPPEEGEILRNLLEFEKNQATIEALIPKIPEFQKYEKKVILLSNLMKELSEYVATFGDLTDKNSIGSLLIRLNQDFLNFRKAKLRYDLEVLKRESSDLRELELSYNIPTLITDVFKGEFKAHLGLAKSIIGDLGSLFQKIQKIPVVGPAFKGLFEGLLFISEKGKKAISELVSSLPSELELIMTADEINRMTLADLNKKIDALSALNPKRGLLAFGYLFNVIKKAGLLPEIIYTPRSELVKKLSELTPEQRADPEFLNKFFYSQEATRLISKIESYFKEPYDWQEVTVLQRTKVKDFLPENLKVLYPEFLAVNYLKEDETLDVGQKVWVPTISEYRKITQILSPEVIRGMKENYPFLLNLADFLHDFILAPEIIAWEGAVKGIGVLSRTLKEAKLLREMNIGLERPRYLQNLGPFAADVWRFITLRPVETEAFLKTFPTFEKLRLSLWKHAILTRNLPYELERYLNIFQEKGAIISSPLWIESRLLEIKDRLSKAVGLDATRSEIIINELKKVKPRDWNADIISKILDNFPEMQTAERKLITKEILNIPIESRKISEVSKVLSKIESPSRRQKELEAFSEILQKFIVESTWQPGSLDRFIFLARICDLPFKESLDLLRNQPKAFLEKVSEALSKGNLNQNLIRYFEKETRFGTLKLTESQKLLFENAAAYADKPEKMEKILAEALKPSKVNPAYRVFTEKDVQVVREAIDRITKFYEVYGKEVVAKSKILVKVPGLTEIRSTKALTSKVKILTTKTERGPKYTIYVNPERIDKELLWFDVSKEAIESSFEDFLKRSQNIVALRSRTGFEVSKVHRFKDSLAEDILKEVSKFIDKESISDFKILLTQKEEQLRILKEIYSTSDNQIKAAVRKYSNYLTDFLQENKIDLNKISVFDLRRLIGTKINSLKEIIDFIHSRNLIAKKIDEIQNLLSKFEKKFYKELEKPVKTTGLTEFGEKERTLLEILSYSIFDEVEKNPSYLLEAREIAKKIVPPKKISVKEQIRLPISFEEQREIASGFSKIENFIKEEVRVIYDFSETNSLLIKKLLTLSFLRKIDPDGYFVYKTILENAAKAKKITNIEKLEYAIMKELDKGTQLPYLVSKLINVYSIPDRERRLAELNKLLRLSAENFEKHVKDYMLQRQLKAGEAAGIPRETIIADFNRRFNILVKKEPGVLYHIDAMGEPLLIPINWGKIEIPVEFGKIALLRERYVPMRGFTAKEMFERWKIVLDKWTEEKLKEFKAIPESVAEQIKILTQTIEKNKSELPKLVVIADEMGQPNTKKIELLKRYILENPNKFFEISPEISKSSEILAKWAKELKIPNVKIIQKQLITVPKKKFLESIKDSELELILNFGKIIPDNGLLDFYKLVPDQLNELKLWKSWSQMTQKEKLGYVSRFQEIAENKWRELSPFLLKTEGGKSLLSKITLMDEKGFDLKMQILSQFIEAKKALKTSLGTRDLFVRGENISFRVGSTTEIIERIKDGRLIGEIPEFILKQLKEERKLLEMRKEILESAYPGRFKTVEEFVDKFKQLFPSNLFKNESDLKRFAKGIEALKARRMKRPEIISFEDLGRAENFSTGIEEQTSKLLRKVDVFQDGLEVSGTLRVLPSDFIPQEVFDDLNKFEQEIANLTQKIDLAVKNKAPASEISKLEKELAKLKSKLDSKVLDVLEQMDETMKLTESYQVLQLPIYDPVASILYLPEDLAPEPLKYLDILKQSADNISNFLEKYAAGFEKKPFLREAFRFHEARFRLIAELYPEIKFSIDQGIFKSVEDFLENIFKLLESDKKVIVASAKNKFEKLFKTKITVLGDTPKEFQINTFDKIALKGFSTVDFPPIEKLTPEINVDRYENLLRIINPFDFYLPKSLPENFFTTRVVKDLKPDFIIFLAPKKELEELRKIYPEAKIKVIKGGSFLSKEFDFLTRTEFEVFNSMRSAIFRGKKIVVVGDNAGVFLERFNKFIPKKEKCIFDEVSDLIKTVRIEEKPAIKGPPWRFPRSEEQLRITEEAKELAKKFLPPQEVDAFLERVSKKSIPILPEDIPFDLESKFYESLKGEINSIFTDPEIDKIAQEIYFSKFLANKSLVLVSIPVKATPNFIFTLEIMNRILSLKFPNKVIFRVYIPKGVTKTKAIETLRSAGIKKFSFIKNPESFIKRLKTDFAVFARKPEDLTLSLRRKFIVDYKTFINSVKKDIFEASKAISDASKALKPLTVFEEEMFRKNVWKWFGTLMQRNAMKKLSQEWLEGLKNVKAETLNNLRKELIQKFGNLPGIERLIEREASKFDKIVANINKFIFKIGDFPEAESLIERGLLIGLQRKIDRYLTSKLNLKEISFSISDSFVSPSFERFRNLYSLIAKAATASKEIFKTLRNAWVKAVLLYRPAWSIYNALSDSLRSALATREIITFFRQLRLFTYINLKYLTWLFPKKIVVNSILKRKPLTPAEIARIGEILTPEKLAMTKKFGIPGLVRKLVGAEDFEKLWNIDGWKLPLKPKAPDISLAIRGTFANIYDDPRIIAKTYEILLRRPDLSSPLRTLFTIIDTDTVMLANLLESTRRLLTFQTLLRDKAMDIARASMRTRLFMFDYTDLSTAERLFRSIFPFFAFNVKSVQLWLYLAKRHGPRVLRAARFYVNCMNEAMKDVPDYLKSKVPVPGTGYLVYVPFEFLDIFRVIAEPMKAIEEFLDNPERLPIGLSWDPFISITLQVLTGKKYYETSRFIADNEFLATSEVKEKMKNAKLEDRNMAETFLSALISSIPQTALIYTFIPGLAKVNERLIEDQTNLFNSPLNFLFRFLGLNITKIDDWDRISTLYFHTDPLLRTFFIKHIKEANPKAYQAFKNGLFKVKLLKVMNSKTKEEKDLAFQELMTYYWLDKYFTLEDQKKGEGERRLLELAREGNKLPLALVRQKLKEIDSKWEEERQIEAKKQEIKSAFEIWFRKYAKKEITPLQILKASAIGIADFPKVPFSPDEIRDEILYPDGTLKYDKFETVAEVVGKWAETKGLPPLTEEHLRQAREKSLDYKLMSYKDKLDQKVADAIYNAKWATILSGVPENFEKLPVEERTRINKKINAEIYKLLTPSEIKRWKESRPEYLETLSKFMEDYVNRWSDLISKSSKSDLADWNIYIDGIEKQPAWFKRVWFVNHPEERELYPFNLQRAKYLQFDRRKRLNGEYSDLANRYFWSDEPEAVKARSILFKDKKYKAYMTQMKKISESIEKSFQERDFSEGFYTKFFNLPKELIEFHYERIAKFKGKEIAKKERLFDEFAFELEKARAKDRENRLKGVESNFEEELFNDPKYAEIINYFETSDRMNAGYKAFMLAKFAYSKVSDKISWWQYINNEISEEARQYYFRHHLGAKYYVPVLAKYDELTLQDKENKQKGVYTHLAWEYISSNRPEVVKAREELARVDPGRIKYYKFWNILSLYAEKGLWKLYFETYFSKENETNRKRHWASNPKNEQYFKLWAIYQLMPTKSWEDRKAKREFLRANPLLQEFFEKDKTVEEKRIGLLIDQYYQILDQVPAFGDSREYFELWKRQNYLAEKFLTDHPEIQEEFNKFPKKYTGQDEKELFDKITRYNLIILREDKRKFLEENPDVKEYFRLQVPPGIRKVLKLQDEYFKIEKFEDREEFLKKNPSLALFWEVNDLPASYFLNPEKFKPYQEAVEEAKNYLKKWLTEDWSTLEPQRRMLSKLFTQPEFNEESIWLQKQLYQEAMKTWMEIIKQNKLKGIIFFRLLPNWIRTIYYSKHPEKKYISKYPLSRFIEEPLRIEAAKNVNLFRAFQLHAKYGIAMPPKVSDFVKDQFIKAGIWEDRSSWTRTDWDRYWEKRAIELSQLKEKDFIRFPLLRQQLQEVIRTFPVRGKPEPFKKPILAKLPAVEI